jgi:hypothetical protein
MIVAMPRDGAIIFSDLMGKLEVTCEKCGRDGRFATGSVPHPEPSRSWLARTQGAAIDARWWSLLIWNQVPREKNPQPNQSPLDLFNSVGDKAFPAFKLLC